MGRYEKMEEDGRTRCTSTPWGPTPPILSLLVQRNGHRIWSAWIALAFPSISYCQSYLS